MARVPTIKTAAIGLAVVAVVVLALSVYPFDRTPPSSGVGANGAKPALVPAEPQSPIRFEDVTAAVGVLFHHVDGATDMHYVMEVMGSGVGWIDYDQDGLMDLFLVQGATCVPPHSRSPPASKLFKNLGGGQFRDVTAEVGLGHIGCGMGVAVGDFDNDGFPDLFLTCYGTPNVLYHNVSDGKGGRRFVDVTAAAGLGAHPDWATRPNYSTSAAFLDFDNDGRLDLFVCSYVKVDLAHYPKCPDPRGKRDICHPSAFEGTHCVLYQNNGDGTFTDVSEKSGIAQPRAKALGVVALDLDDDGLIDIFVANDGVPNFLFRNLGNGRFEAKDEACGCLVNANGHPQAYMGVDAGDIDDDGLADLFATALTHESSTLFRNEGGCRFLDVTKTTGLGPPTWFMVGFGTCFLDADNDGRLDIVVVNGHISRHIDELGDKNLTYRQRAQLFWNEGRSRFREITQAGPYFQQRHVGRGAAPCDFDNDGRIDLAVSNNGEQAFLLHNESVTPNHWIRLELQGTKSNRDAVGAKVTLHVADGRKLVRHRKGGTSYLSAADPRLLVGLGAATRVERLEIRWPSGLKQQVGPLAADCAYRVVEGEEKATVRP